MNIETAIAANRFGLGARPGELAGIDGRHRDWLLKQIAGPSRTPDVLRSLPASAGVLGEVLDLRRSERQARKKGDDIERRYGKLVRRHYVDQVLARYQLAATSEYPFFERLVHFWSNHFAVSADKQPVPAIAGLYENEAIRPHVAGKFAELLIAAEQHPAMILYLDNQRSVGPGSTLGKRANRRQQRTVGLNENLAREILELHTLGVGGGYTQQDVTGFANVITGWSVGGSGENGRFAEGEPGTFEFREAIHEPGPQSLLGRRYEQKGMAQGVAVLRDLAVHPSTARFLASKLARHFVTDEPPEELVASMSNAYLRSGGELSALYETLINSDAAWQQAPGKYKSPHDFLVSAWRALDHVPADGRPLAASFDTLGQVPFRPGSPAGWPDIADHWGGADALYKRIEWSDTVARIAGRRINPLTVGDSALGPALSARTRSSIARAESVQQGTTLLLASPDFQRR